MPKKNEAGPPPGSPRNPIPLPKKKKYLERYYSRGRLPSPMGGKLDILDVREGERGKGRVLLECNASSLRFILEIPRATPEERKQVEKSLDGKGEDPTCPRHGSSQRLTRSGKEWVCPLCGVVYGKAE